jgi:hypothetical protein
LLFCPCDNKQSARGGWRRAADALPIRSKSGRLSDRVKDSPFSANSLSSTKRAAGSPLKLSTEGVPTPASKQHRLDRHRPEFPGETIGTVISTHPTIANAFTANDAFQKNSGAKSHIPHENRHSQSTQTSALLLATSDADNFQRLETGTGQRSSFTNGLEIYRDALEFVIIARSHFPLTTLKIKWIADSAAKSPTRAGGRLIE